MNCPKCKTHSLMPTRLEEGLPAMGCKQCGGKLLSLLYYRDWAQRSTAQLSDEPVSLEKLEESDTKTAMACSKCSRLMSKYRILADSSNRLDICGNCDEAWIDQEEWAFLKSNELAKDLSKIFTDQWQGKVRIEELANIAFDRLVDQIGKEDALKAQTFLDWLSGRQDKATIIQYLGRA